MDFTLRPWAMNDLDSLVKFANNKEISKFMNDQFPYPYTHENGINFIQLATSDDPIHIFAIDIDEQAVGGIGIHQQKGIERKNAELGYWLAQPFWGKGIITKAVTEITAFGFKTYNINRIFARPFHTNIASQKVLEKAGFTLEARFTKTFFKHGENLDELVYAMRK